LPPYRSARIELAHSPAAAAERPIGKYSSNTALASHSCDHGTTARDAPMREKARTIRSGPICSSFF
jgi:hypothetical protein